MNPGRRNWKWTWPASRFSRGSGCGWRATAPLSGKAPATALGARGPVVDNNGIHGMAEKSGSVYLKAGRQPIRVDWFNGVEKYGLEVEYEGPGLIAAEHPGRRVVPGADGRDGRNKQLCQTGWIIVATKFTGEVLPDFSRQTAIKSGTATNFDLSVLPHPEHSRAAIHRFSRGAVRRFVHLLHEIG